MFQDRTILISLDINDTTIVSVTAKQYDTGSRFIEATCTENGKKMNIDGEIFKAIVVCNKPDDTVVVNNATILSNGNVLIELTKQMLAVSGKCTCDLMLFDVNENIDVNNMTDIGVIKTYALSTMPFYVNVIAFAVNNESITSTNEFKTFVDHISTSISIEKTLQENEKTRQENEELRQTNTQNAINLCDTATSNANTATSACKTQTEACKTATSSVNEAISGANDAASRCDAAILDINTTKETVIENINNAIEAANITINNTVETANTNVNNAIESANSATERAIQAAEDCEGITDGTSLVLKSDLYDENSLVKNSKLNTSFTNQPKQVIVSGEELSIILGKIAAYMNAFDNRQQILYNASNPSAEPNNSVGNNGDIYVKVIQE